MILSDRSIIEAVESGRLVIEPFDRDKVQPASVDLRLGFIDKPPAINAADGTDTDLYCIGPGDFVLASTLERLHLPNDIAGFISGRSSYGRKGLIVETAGFIDPGFDGTLTLEIANINKWDRNHNGIWLSIGESNGIWLRIGESICQVSFIQMTTPAIRPYGSDGLGSKYQGQTGPTVSRR